MKMSIALVFTALTACESSATTNPPVTATSARIEARQMPSSSSPLPQLPEDTAVIPDTTMTTESVMPTSNKRDERIEKSLRSAIAADDTLSPEAKQVEVIVKDRKIILKGQAHSEHERMNIDTKARATDDVIDVDDQIQLVP